jgi:hypothetical protein
MRPKFFSLIFFFFIRRKRKGRVGHVGVGLSPACPALVESGNTGGAVVWCVKGGTPVRRMGKRNDLPKKERESHVE